jgi:opacity protein-like surface antigen
MRKLIFGVAVVAASMTAMSSSAVAQMPVSIGLLGGATMPLGSWSDFYGTGWHGGVTLGMEPAMLPIGLRLEGVYHSMSGKEEFDEDATWTFINGNINGVFDIAMTGSPIQPYVIGGVGLYNWKEEGSDFETDRMNDFGLNIGGGVRFMLGTMSAFVEARWHHIMIEDDAAHMVPISFGITIR